MTTTMDKARESRSGVEDAASRLAVEADDRAAQLAFAIETIRDEVARYSASSQSCVRLWMISESDSTRCERSSDDHSAATPSGQLTTGALRTFRPSTFEV
jgi:hypothetical protein